MIPEPPPCEQALRGARVRHQDSLRAGTIVPVNHRMRPRRAFIRAETGDDDQRAEWRRTMWSMEEARLLGRVIEQERGRALAAPVGRAVRPPSARRARMARALCSLAARLDPAVGAPRPM